MEIWTKANTGLEFLEWKAECPYIVKLVRDFCCETWLCSYGGRIRETPQGNVGPHLLGRIGFALLLGEGLYPLIG